MRDGVPAEIASLSKAVGFVSETLLVASFFLVNDDLTLVAGGLGDQDGLAVSALEVSTHGRSCLVRTARDFEFVAVEGLVALAHKEPVHDITNSLAQHLSVVVSGDFEGVGLAAGSRFTALVRVIETGVGIVDHRNEFSIVSCHENTSRDLSDK